MSRELLIERQEIGKLSTDLTETLHPTDMDLTAGSQNRHYSKVRVVWVDKFAIKKWHRDFATVVVDFQRV
jgi:hypothetical protein